MNKAIIATLLLAITALAGTGYYMNDGKKLRSTITTTPVLL